MRIKTGRVHLQPRGVISRRGGFLQNCFGHLLFTYLKLIYVKLGKFEAVTVVCLDACVLLAMAQSQTF